MVSNFLFFLLITRLLYNYFFIFLHEKLKHETIEPRYDVDTISCECNTEMIYGMVGVIWKRVDDVGIVLK